MTPRRARSPPPSHEFAGAPHTVPLAYLPDGGDQFLVIGSAGGSPRHPAWFHNLVADPRVTVEDGAIFPAARRAAARAGAGLHVQHARIAALVAQLRETVAGAADPVRLRREVDRLADLLEQHLSHEEEQLVPALDAVLG